MTLYKFNKLDELEQAMLLWQEGAPIGNRMEGGYKILLFQLFSFYAEVYFNVAEKKFERLKTFKGTHGLKCYLQHIDIADVFR